MLHEITNVRQERGSGFRRWFESDELEVIIWFTAQGHVTGFQICFDVGNGGEAVTWREGLGFAHSTIDAGEDSPLANRSPILVNQGRAPWRMVAELFDRNCASLEANLHALIRAKLEEQVQTDGTI